MAAWEKVNTNERAKGREGTDGNMIELTVLTCRNVTLLNKLLDAEHARSERFPGGPDLSAQ